MLRLTKQIVSSTGLSLISHLGLLLLTLSLASCGLTKMGNRVSGASCTITDVKQAFQTNVMPVFAKSCSNCHSDSGYIQTNFASNQVANAYPRSLQIFDVNDAMSSHIMAMSTNGHCGSSLCQPADMGTALQAWATAEQQAIKDKANCSSSKGSTDDGSDGSTSSSGGSATGPSYTLVASKVIEAAGALSTTTYTTLSFPIPGYTGSTITVNIRRYTTANPALSLPGSYQVTGMALISGVALRITNLRLSVVNGASSFADNTFTAVNNDFAAASAPGTTISSFSTTLIQQATTGDQLKVEAVKIGAATGGGSGGSSGYANANCTNVAAFTTNVFNTTVTAGPNCISCHSNGTGGLTMVAGNPTSTCKNFKDFMIKSNLDLSAPYKVILGTQSGHPGLSNANATMATNLKNWAATEQ